MVDKTKPFTASREWLYMLRNKLHLKNIQITGEDASADEEAAATFPAELKKLTRRESKILGKFSTVKKQASFGRKCPTGPIFTKCKTGARI